MDCHVAKVAQSAIATWPKQSYVSKKVGPEAFLKQFFFAGMFLKFFCLQGRKSKRVQITRTENISLFINFVRSAAT